MPKMPFAASSMPAILEPLLFRTEGRDVQVGCQYFILRKEIFKPQRQQNFIGFAGKSHFIRQYLLFDELLRQGGTAALAAETGQFSHQRPQNGLRYDPIRGRKSFRLPLR